MQTGITVPDEVRTEFQNLRMKRKHRYIIFKVSDDKTACEIEKLGARDADWDDFKNSMPKNNSRWAVYDLEFTEDDGRKVAKIIFVMYSPDDNTDNTEKFTIACNKDLVKSKVSEVNMDWQVNRWDDLDFEAIKKKF
mmetsp:Transcript_42039/g.64413  ORF Transcript_42039/g.64413 Transcript_42039/m.64413 type:complete len:137 (-) Transcript_42039:356-766(-)